MKLSLIAFSFGDSDVRVGMMPDTANNAFSLLEAVGLRLLSAVFKGLTRELLVIFVLDFFFFVVCCTGGGPPPPAATTNRGSFFIAFFCFCLGIMACCWLVPCWALFFCSSRSSSFVFCLEVIVAAIYKEGACRFVSVCVCVCVFKCSDKDKGTFTCSLYSTEETPFWIVFFFDNWPIKKW